MEKKYTLTKSQVITIAELLRLSNSKNKFYGVAIDFAHIIFDDDCLMTAYSLVKIIDCYTYFKLTDEEILDRLCYFFNIKDDEESEVK